MKIGLALSGGGFRATIYHLGVLARLAEQNRLEEVTFISTVSGGSLCLRKTFFAGAGFGSLAPSLPCDLHHQGHRERIPISASAEQRTATPPSTKNVSPLPHR